MTGVSLMAPSFKIFQRQMAERFWKRLDRAVDELYHGRFSELMADFYMTGAYQEQVSRRRHRLMPSSRLVFLLAHRVGETVEEILKIPKGREVSFLEYKDEEGLSACELADRMRIGAVTTRKYLKEGLPTRLNTILRARYRLGISIDTTLNSLFLNNEAIPNSLRRSRDRGRVTGTMIPTRRWVDVSLAINIVGKKPMEIIKEIEKRYELTRDMVYHLYYDLSQPCSMNEVETCEAVLNERGPLLKEN